MYLFFLLVYFDVHGIKIVLLGKKNSLYDIRTSANGSILSKINQTNLQKLKNLPNLKESQNQSFVFFQKIKSHLTWQGKCVSDGFRRLSVGIRRKNRPISDSFRRIRRKPSEVGKSSPIGNISVGNRRKLSEIVGSGAVFTHFRRKPSETVGNHRKYSFPYQFFSEFVGTLKNDSTFFSIFLH